MFSCGITFLPDARGNMLLYSVCYPLRRCVLLTELHISINININNGSSHIQTHDSPIHEVMAL